MGCTASSQSRTTAQSPTIQQTNITNSSPPKNDETNASENCNQENEIQPLAVSNVYEEPTKPVEQPSISHDALDGGEKEAESREEPLGEESKEIHQEPIKEDASKEEDIPEQEATAAIPIAKSEAAATSKEEEENLAEEERQTAEETATDSRNSTGNAALKENKEEENPEVNQEDKPQEDKLEDDKPKSLTEENKGEETEKTTDEKPTEETNPDITES